MTIKRQNILSLIGSGRYHSCILTTFSFDFHFFEMKVMRWLRSCGIRNVNVFIDGHFYSELMEHATGDEMKFSSGYSLYPMFHKGIFHPKIWMLFGKHEGLLLVGSGNLTNSGNGSNDEIWGAYHFDIKKPDNSKLFSTAWSYVSQIAASSKGIIGDKTTRWITDHSKWLAELPNPTPFKFLDLPTGDQIALLYNSNSNNIWTSITSLIGNDKVLEVTAVSPYYDSEGKALDEIRKAFPLAKINVILDENGSIPASLHPDKKYSFYDWKDIGLCRGIGADQISKLHAKILHFITQQNKEYCLFGSSNITPTGLGMANNSNTEVSLLLKSYKGEILNKIGLNINEKKRKPLSEFAFNPHDKIYNTIIKNNQFQIYLIAAEINFKTLSIHSIGQVTSRISVALYDTENRLIQVQKIEGYMPFLEIKLNFDESTLKYVQLVSDFDKKEVSNKILTGNYFTISKTHPNPKNEELEQLCNQIQNGELRNVLDLINYAIVDESEKEDGSISIKSIRPAVAEKEQNHRDSHKLYDLSKYKPVEPHSQFYENSILLSPSLRVLDVLKSVHYGNSQSQSDIRIDEQIENIENIDGNEEEEVKIKQTITLRMLESDKRKLKSFFKNLYEYFHHDILFKDTKVSDYKLSLTDLTKYLIALELIHEFGGKSERIEENQQQLFFSYLPATGDYINDNVKGCCLNIIGDFLRLSRNGFKDYTFEYTRKKFDQLKHDALVSTIVCILNVTWKEDERFYIQTLLLNTLHYLGWAKSKEIDNYLDLLISEVKEKAKTIKQRSSHLEDHLFYFTEKLCRAFKMTTKKREARVSSTLAKKGQIIYSSIAGVGYCYVISISGKNEYCLARPGFDWNENECEYINHFGGKIYQPLPLPSVIVVEI